MGCVSVVSRYYLTISTRGVARGLAFDLLSIAVSAASVALAIGSSQLQGLILVALVPLLLFVLRRTPSRAASCGAIWGVCLWIACRGGLGPTLASPWAALILLTVVPGAYAGGGAILTRWIGFSPLVLGVAWMGVEVALDPVGLRLGLLGATLEQGLLAQTLGSAFGYVLVAFVVAYINAILVSVFDRVRTLSSGTHPPSSSGDRPRVVEPQTRPIHSHIACNPSQPRAPPITTSLIET